MSIWQDKRGRRHVGVQVDGRRVHRILAEGASSGDAKQAEAAIREAIGRRGLTIPGDPPLTAIMGLYMRHADTLRSPESGKQHAARCGPWIEGFRASQAVQAVAAMVQDMAGKYEAATVNRTIGTIKKALSLAWDRGMIPANYGLRVKRLPEHNARDVVLTVEQVAAIAGNASEQVRAAIWIALYTGMRRGEILALRAQDVGADTLTVRAGSTKTLRTRTVPIVAPLRPWLAYVPLALNFEGLKSGWQRARLAAGVPWATFHDLRRTCGTMMVQAGVDLYVVSKVLGHSSPAVTAKHYAHLQTDRMRDGLEQTFAPAAAPAKRAKRRNVA